MLDEVLRYDLFYYSIHLFEWKLFELETHIDSHYFIFNFYQINRDDEIQTRDHLIIKVLISY